MAVQTEGDLGGRRGRGGRTSGETRVGLTLPEHGGGGMGMGPRRVWAWVPAAPLTLAPWGASGVVMVGWGRLRRAACPW